jgi:ATP-dependent Lon protease
MGGSTLYIETLGQKAKLAGTGLQCGDRDVQEQEGGSVELTENLWDVMKESIKIGGPYARLDPALVCHLHLPQCLPGEDTT